MSAPPVPNTIGSRNRGLPDQQTRPRSPQRRTLRNHRKQIIAHAPLILMFLPGLIYFVVFHYIPMGGIVLAFKDYDVRQGIWGSDWVGLDNFRKFFGSYFASRIIGNAIKLNLASLIFAFPMPLLFALLLNEVRSERFKRMVQTFSYFPHFVSAVVMVGIMRLLLSPDIAIGVINQVRSTLFGLAPVNFLARPELFRTIYVAMLVWQGTGFGAIIYLASLAAVDVEQYDAAIIDGAGRLQLMRYISLPALAPTIVMLLLLSISSLLRSGLETILLMYSPATYSTADVIETFVYRRGIVGQGSSLPDYSFATAVGLFQSIVGLVLIVTANRIARKVADQGLW